MERTCDWKRTSQVGVLETGLFITYEMKPDFKGGNNYPETMMVIHCFGREKKVLYLNVRFYFKGNKYLVSDGFFHWVSDDVRSILEEDYDLSIEKDFVMHAEYYADINKFSRVIPFTLGDYTL